MECGYEFKVEVEVGMGVGVDVDVPRSGVRSGIWNDEGDKGYG